MVLSPVSDASLSFPGAGFKAGRRRQTARKRPFLCDTMGGTPVRHAALRQNAPDFLE
jgi:hypothetical protein